MKFFYFRSRKLIINIHWIRTGARTLCTLSMLQHDPKRYNYVQSNWVWLIKNRMIYARSVNSTSIPYKTIRCHIETGIISRTHLSSANHEKSCQLNWQIWLQLVFVRRLNEIICWSSSDVLLQSLVDIFYRWAVREASERCYWFIRKWLFGPLPKFAD